MADAPKSKMKAAPKLPQGPILKPSEKKSLNQQPDEESKGINKRRMKDRRDRKPETPTVTFSGPFAQGPAAMVKQKPSISRQATSNPIKTEGTNAVVPVSMVFERLAKDSSPSSDDEDERMDEIATRDPWAPHTIETHKKHVRFTSRTESDQQVKIKVEDDPMLGLTFDEDQQEMLRSEPKQSSDTPLSSLPTNELIFFQFPKALPMLAKLDATTQQQQSLMQIDVKHENDSKDALEANVDSLLSTGSLRIHESGRISLKIDNLILDVSAEPISNFTQSIVNVNKRKGRVCFLGDIKNRFLCTPNI